MINFFENLDLLIQKLSLLIQSQRWANLCKQVLPLKAFTLHKETIAFLEHQKSTALK